MKSLLEQRADRAGRAEGGEMGERIRRYDWTSTPLGPIEAWPPGLGNAVDLMLASPLPTVLTWGERATQLFNDPFLPILAGLLGPRQARALGQDFEDCWRGAFPGTGLPLHEPAAAVVDDGQRLFLSRDRQPNDAPLQG